jgi:cytochrome c peroxidase
MNICFKVPSLRNIEKTGPYMHDGRFETLDQVLNHYDK